MIKKINEIKIQTFVILGNHDRGRDRNGETLRKQIRILGDKYCAWDLKIVEDSINLLGARPCSSGGGYFLSKEVLGVYGPLSEEDSVRKIIAASMKAREDLPLIIISHAGPSGLGSQPNSICGKDWKVPSSDWGDRDLARAISEIKKHRSVDLVVFGHMHNVLSRNLGSREMFQIDRNGTAYLNSAIVPRFKYSKQGKSLSNFSWVEFEDGKLKHISHRWYYDDGKLKEQQILL